MELGGGEAIWDTLITIWKVLFGLLLLAGMLMWLLKRGQRKQEQEKEEKDAAQWLCDHLGNLGLKAEVRDMDPTDEDSRWKRFSEGRASAKVIGRITLKGQEIDEIQIMRLEWNNPFSGTTFDVYIWCCVMKPSPRILFDSHVSPVRQAPDVSASTLNTWRVMGRDSMPGVPSDMDPSAPRVDKTARRVTIAKMNRMPFIRGGLRHPKWRGEELAQLLNHDSALSGMIVQTETTSIKISVLVPDDIVQISGEVKPTVLDLKVYNRIAMHIKEM